MGESYVNISRWLLSTPFLLVGPKAVEVDSTSSTFVIGVGDGVKWCHHYPIQLSDGFHTSPPPPPAPLLRENSGLIPLFSERKEKESSTTYVIVCLTAIRVCVERRPQTNYAP